MKGPNGMECFLSARRPTRSAPANNPPSRKPAKPPPRARDAISAGFTGASTGWGWTWCTIASERDSSMQPTAMASTATISMASSPPPVFTFSPRTVTP